MAEAEPVIVNVSVDASALRRELSDAERLSRGFGRALGDALEAGVVRGRSLGDVLRGLGARMSEIALSAALRPVETAFGSIFSGLTRGLIAGASPVGAGGALNAPPATVAIGAAATSSPSQAGAGAAAAASPAAPVTVHISTPDADSFRRSEAQVSAALARAVARGRRGL